MKIIDSNKIDGKNLQCDVCIVGSGPAGITLASKLADGNLDVIIVESGGAKFDKKQNELNMLNIDSNFTYRGGKSDRNRQIGGTANIWTGRVLPFVFNPKLDEEWGNLKTSLLPFYDNAFRFFGIDPAIQNEHYYSEDKLYAYWGLKTERFNSKSNILKSIGNGRIYKYLTLVGEPEFQGNRIHQLSFVNQKQESVKIKSVAFVFAMGGIANSRMLLILREQIGNSISQHLENVGKYIMDHPRIWHGKIRMNGQSQLPELSRHQIKSTDFGMYKTGIRNQADTTRVYCNLMKTAKRVNNLMDRIPIKSYQISAQRLFLREKGLLRVIANELVRFHLIKHSVRFKNFLMDFFNEDPPQDYNIMAYCEQRPREENRIQLSDERDRNNLEIPVLKNKIHQEELNEVLSFYEKLEKLEVFGDYRLEYDTEILSDPSNYSDASHIMGGTRYSSDPSKAVVDENLSVLGIPNLYIAGSSVFPTSGVENPTHLIVTLSCYLGEVLKRRFTS